MRIIGYVIILIVIGYAILGAAVKLGFGSHDEPIGEYQIHVPWGWDVPAYRTSTWLAAVNWFGGSLTIEILSPESLQAEAKSYRTHFGRERDFPKAAPEMHSTATAISNLMINDIPFQKAYWSCKGTDIIPPVSRSIIRGQIPNSAVYWGFEFRSLPINKQIIRCEAKSVNENSLHSAEEIVLSLKKRKL